MTATPYRYVKIGATLLDSESNPLNSGWAFANGTGSLESGETHEFSILISSPEESYTSVSCEVLEAQEK